MIDLKDNVTLITGGGSGIGRETCLAFTKAGAIVVVVDIDVEGGEKTVSLIEKLGGESIFIEADVSKSSDVENYVNKTMEKYGRIDTFFNNAGITGPSCPIHEYPEDMFDKVVAINMKGVFLGLKYVLAVMIKQGSGSIINTSSTSGMKGYVNLCAYSSTKHAVVGLTRISAGEVAQTGVRVNAICPGPVDTGLIERLASGTGRTAEEQAEIKKRISLVSTPRGRFADVNEVARVVIFLASNYSEFINGAVLPIDAGITAI
jgi:3alpha(or 20beta)-hydroxysteroid dehydrogenase